MRRPERELFEPFFTTKAIGKGSGLGLSMVQGFCHQSGGDVRIVTDGVVGTRVELWLPAAAATSRSGRRSTLILPALAGRPAVYCWSRMNPMCRSHWQAPW